MDTNGFFFFFSKSEHFFRCSKKAGEASLPPPRGTPVSVAEYAYISQKMLEKTVLCQGSEYTFSSYMFHRLLKMPVVLNKPGF